MYFRLDADVASMSQYWEAQNNQHVMTILGELLSVNDDAIELPFRFTVSFSPDLEGKPKRQPLYDFVPSTNAMHKRLVTTMQAAGVDNLQIFPAQVVDAISGAISSDYVVVNVVGMVSAANLAESQSRELADVRVFDKLVLDVPKARKLLMFRLAESQMEIIIDAKVADAIRHGKFAGVVLDPVTESTGP